MTVGSRTADGGVGAVVRCLRTKAGHDGTELACIRGTVRRVCRRVRPEERPAIGRRPDVNEYQVSHWGALLALGADELDEVAVRFVESESASKPLRPAVAAVT